jgi:hypothetical protein
MPRYIVQRTFPEVLQTPIANGGADRCRGLTEHNAGGCVTWVHSYVSEDEGTTFRVYDVSTPNAIRKTAHRNELPVDQITQVRVPDPYFYVRGGRMRTKYPVAAASVAAMNVTMTARRATMPSPSRRITVEPLTVPLPSPYTPAPVPPPEIDPTEEPAPVRDPVPTP